MIDWTSFLLIGLLAVVLFPLVCFWRERKLRIERLLPNTVALDATSIPNFRQSLPTLNREHTRARRHGQPLSIIVVQTKAGTQRNGVKSRVSKGSEPGESDSQNLNPFELLLCGPVIRDAVRESDITTYDGLHNRFVIALPQSNKEQAFQAAHRFDQILGDDIAKRLNVGIAEFPTDALFVDQLIDIAANNQSIEVENGRANAKENIYSIT